MFKTIEERFSLIKKDKETISIILNDESDKSLKFPTKGVLFTKDYLKRLEYSQMNYLYEFTVTDGKPKMCDDYVKIKYKKVSEELNIMTYDEFVNYLYTEGYIDEKPKQTKHK